jgi:DNA-binding NtrC family response regulator/polyferredoxin
MQIMGPGEPGDPLRILVSGHAAVYLREGADEPISVDTLVPGDVIGQVAFLTGNPLPPDCEVVAEGPCEVVDIPAKRFEALLRQDNEFGFFALKALAEKVSRMSRQVLQGKQKRRALQSLISREDHLFPDYVVGDYIRHNLSERVEDLAQSEGPILILGENGVGKEVLAHTIFKMSRRYKEVFLLLDLLRAGPSTGARASGAEELQSTDDEQRQTAEQEALFFGSEEVTAEGAFRETPGYVELTEEGALLVRGVERLTARMQLLLLDAVQGGKFRRAGSTVSRIANFRLIATSELDKAEIDPERHPLIHGLMPRSLAIPPLRNRRREIPKLIRHYVEKYSAESHKAEIKLPQQTMKTLLNYSWPGNDLELSMTLKRAIMVCEGDTLKPQDIYFDLKRVEGKGKFNLLRIKPVRQAIKSPLYPAVLQSAVTPFFFILLGLLFLGPSDPTKNAAALFCWAVGWPTLIIGSFVWARFWCTLCPIGVISNLSKKLISLEKPFPAFLKTKSDFLLAGAVLCIIWMETATGIRNSPIGVAILLVAMLISAILTAVIFERQSWCRYLCGLGGMISVLAKASMVELRADRNVCIANCTTNECFLGSLKEGGCPFGQAGPKLHSNRLCKLCGACVKNCPHGAINLCLRAPGKELWEIRHTNTGTAFLVVGMIGGLLAEMMTKTPLYKALTAHLPFGEVFRFTVVFLGTLALVNLLCAAATIFSRETLGDSFQENYSRYALALLPLTLTAYMAFHVYYLVNLGVQLPILLSRMFDFEIFRRLIITVPRWVTHAAQTGLVAVGFAWSLTVMWKLARAGVDRPLAGLVGVLPHAIVAAILAYVVNISLTHFFYF